MREKFWSSRKTMNHTIWAILYRQYYMGHTVWLIPPIQIHRAIVSYDWQAMVIVHTSGRPPQSANFTANHFGQSSARWIIQKRNRSWSNYSPSKFVHMNKWTDEPSEDSRLGPDRSNPGNTCYQFFNFKSSFCPAIKCILLTICIWTFFTFDWNIKIIFINWQITSCGRVDLDAVSI